MKLKLTHLLLDIDWIGINSLALFCNSVTGLKREIFDIQNRYSQLDRQLKYHEKSSKEIVNQLRQANKQYQDREWQLQETLVHTENVLKLEVEGARMLRERVAALEEKLTEVEGFMSSERGQLCLKLEEELAAAKLGLAELESEKDELMLRLQSIENVTPANSRAGFKQGHSGVASLHGNR